MARKNVKEKLSFQFDLISTCYHEAGHAIYALLNFMKVLKIGIKSDDRVGGYTNYESLEYNIIIDQNLRYSILIREVCINYAGLTCEKIFYKNICGSNIFPMVLRTGSCSDHEIAWKLIKDNNLSPSGKRHNFKKKLIREVTKVLIKYWDDVIVIAHDLFNRNKISYQRLYVLLTVKSANKDFWKSRLKEIKHIFKYESYDEIHIKNLLNVV